MWGQRIIRLVIVGVIAVGVIWLSSRMVKNNSVSNPIKLPNFSFNQPPKENLLGAIEEKILGAKNEPISQPVGNIQQQTQSIIEAIKNLPADQLEAVKKQIFEEFCSEHCSQTSEE